MKRPRPTVAKCAMLTLLTLAAGGLQAGEIWSRIDSSAKAKAGAVAWVTPDVYTPFALDEGELTDLLSGAPSEKSNVTGFVLPFPMPDGDVEYFEVAESSIMAPELAAWMAGEGYAMKTYTLRGLGDSTITGRMDWGGPAGFHAILDSPDGEVFVDPLWEGDTTEYASYYRKDYSKADRAFACDVVRSPDEEKNRSVGGVKGVSGNLKSFRLACAATGEYTAFHGGTVATGQAAIVTTINRVNQVYERDLSVRLVLVANNQALVFTNGGSDPYSNDDGTEMLDENQAEVDNVIGSGNYDIGHVFSTGGGGIAGLGVICFNPRKAEGVTGSPQPVGDPFNIDYVCHEIGHQFGGEHTFNSSLDACGGGNRSSSAAYEPGSGSTIMGYAGICSRDNLQSNSDPYFHVKSLNEILATIDTVSCFTTTDSGNTSDPAVHAGGDFTIPANTPFELTATGSDADGDSLTWCWEQYDLGNSTSLDQGDTGSGPILRSFGPSVSPTRTFPRLPDLLANTTTLGETLPTTNRQLNFRVTARDNHLGGGRTSNDGMILTVTNTGEPFAITSQSAGNETLSGPVLVTWNVANTDTAPISCSNVSIHLSTDGGNTFTEELVASTANDGSEMVMLPNINESECRIRVKALNNVFFDINSVNFAVVPGVPTPVFSALIPFLVDFGGNGNNNGLADPGESTLDLGLPVENSGTAEATSLTAVLSSPSPTVTILNGEREISSLDILSVALFDFTFALSPSHPCGEPIEFELVVDSDETEPKTISFSLDTGIAGTSVELAEDFDTSNSFTFDTPEGNGNWLVRANEQAHSAPNVMSYEPGADAVTDSSLVSPAVVGADRLTFRHSFEFEASNGSNWDGGVLEISTDGGSAWADLDSSIISGGYTGVLSTIAGNPLGGRNSWTGGSFGSMSEVDVDLSAYSSETIQVRWRFGADESFPSGGWRIDNVVFTTTTYSCEPPLNSPLPELISIY